MKNPSKTLLPLAGMLLLGTAFLRAEEPAATPPPPPPPAEHHERHGEMRGDLEKMARELNLTAEQKTQIEAIRKQTHDSMKAIRSDASLSDDQKREKGRELMKSGMEQERAILTPEQQAKAKTLRGKHGHHGPDDGPPPPPPGDAAPPPPPPAPAT
jgi:Spy/CpxP family protein refolding chaperone